MRIEIKSTELKNKQGTGKTSGKAYNFFEQKAWAHLPDKPYPIEMTLTVDSGSSAYAQGMYDLNPSSFYVNKYGQLEVKPKLVAIK